MPGTVLVAEDDVMIRNAIVATLVLEQYEVLEADSADEVLKLSRELDRVIDLIVADSLLKTMKDRQSWEKIQQSRPHLKVLQISGYTLNRLRRDQNLIPGAQYLRKPFSPRVLVNKVRQIFGSIENLASAASGD